MPSGPDHCMYNQMDVTNLTRHSAFICFPLLHSKSSPFQQNVSNQNILYRRLCISCNLTNLALVLYQGCGAKSRRNYAPHILCYVITCPCPWYLLLAHHSSYVSTEAQIRCLKIIEFYITMHRDRWNIVGQPGQALIKHTWIMLFIHFSMFENEFRHIGFCIWSLL